MINQFDGKFAFLSNFYPSKISETHGLEVIIYPTVEHAFQADKTTDINTRKYIAQLSTPGKAKRAGRNVNLRSDWETKKIIRMANCIHAKFLNTELRKQLLSTGEEELIEGNNWHDNFWGDCQCEKCKHIQGKNVLGKILMNERESIRRESKED